MGPGGPGFPGRPIVPYPKRNFKHQLTGAVTGGSFTVGNCTFTTTRKLNKFYLAFWCNKLFVVATIKRNLFGLVLHTSFPLSPVNPARPFAPAEPYAKDIECKDSFGTDS